MGVEYIRPFGGRDATFGKITSWSAKRLWLAKTTDPFIEEWPILDAGWAAGILPIPYTSVLGTVPILLCREISCAQQKNSPTHWIITATYSSEPLSQQQRDEQQYENPLDRPAKIRWNSSKYNKAVIEDIDNKPILNSAGDPYDPPAEADRSRWIAVVQKNVTGVPTVIIDYTDAINESAFTIQGIDVGPKVAKIQSIEISEVQTAQTGPDSNVEYVSWTYSLEFRPETWTLKLLDQGYRQKDPNDSTKRILIKDDSVPAKDISKPWPLNGSGVKLTNPSPTTAVKRSHEIYNAKDFSLLPGINE